MFAAACHTDRTSVTVDAALLTLVPEDATALGAIRVKALRNTPVWKRLLENPEINWRAEEFARETSFDIRQHLWELLWSTGGKEVLFFARGEFAPMGLEPKLERQGAQRMNYKGSMLIGNGLTAVWFVNSSTAVFGKTPKLHQLIDARDKRGAGPSPALRERIASLPPGAHIWAVANQEALSRIGAMEGPGSDTPGNLMRNLPKLLLGVESLMLQANLSDGIGVESAAHCRDEKSTRQVYDSLRGLLGVARFTIPQGQRDSLLPILDSLQVEQKATTATLRAHLTTAQAETLLTALGGTRGTPRTGE
jgi:hypothetical protein